MRPRDVHSRRDDVQVVDVREPHEWRAGHIGGAAHIPMGEVVARLDEIARDRPVAVVCRSGHRSATVADFLTTNGFDAHNVEGGMLAWACARLPFAAEGGGPGRVA